MRETLRTQVSEILRVNIGKLSEIPQHLVYDHVLDTPDLLHECFQTFRNQPDLFRKVVFRKDKRPATQGDDELWCGRTLDHVVALVVRASARRYFREALPAPPPPPMVVEPPPSILHKTAIKLGIKKPIHRAPYVAPQGPGDKLYTVFRDNLRFEWQVPLIPSYSSLTPSIVRVLGPRILKLREPTQIDILANEGLGPDGRLPLLLEDARRLRAVDGSIDSNALMEAFTKQGLDAIFPDLDDVALRKAVSQIAVMETKAVDMIFPALEYALKPVTVFLFAAYYKLELKGFRQAFGSHCALWAVQKLSKHLETQRPWPRSMPGMKSATLAALAHAIDLDSGMPASAPVRAAPKSVTGVPSNAAVPSMASAPPPAPPSLKKPAAPPSKADLERASRRAKPLTSAGAR
ncbi:hypothetical protein CCC_03211 [Paramagnetospirillum magnetotacticum MS-1]|uniref:Uncharacterized protein n=1 Tax=Paramagnetospirillum magnetotacticum MS-1 TaxID=272627 RepID=A0A0C2YZV4_PARME|nr:hypothetical protein CCC_03211 [Paramagnetospirillum magnetotacticum MS-1]